MQEVGRTKDPRTHSMKRTWHHGTHNIAHLPSIQPIRHPIGVAGLDRFAGGVLLVGSRCEGEPPSYLLSHSPSPTTRVGIIPSTI